MKPRLIASLGAGLAGLIIVLPALGVDLPKRKAGLWEMVYQADRSDKDPMPRAEFCLDEATDAALYQKGLNMSRDMCSKMSVNGSGSQFTIDSVCKLGNHTITSHTVLIYEGNTSYRHVSDSHMDPPMPPVGPDSHHVMVAKWLGPCKPGQKPGQFIVERPTAR